MKAKEDSYGHAVNEYEEAMEILENIMDRKVFEGLKSSCVR